MIELNPPVERALLVAAVHKGRNGNSSSSSRRRDVAEHLEELGELVDTAGAVVVGALTQQIERPNPATFLGSGKITELREEVDRTGATLIIFDDDLTPTQGKNIEDTTGRRVMDRTEVILDIFATRARSNEARLQVELAQLEYLLPRLTRMWAHLERFKGGIGMRGPGETQLETDRRLINHRIKVLRQRLDQVEKTRRVQRHGRRDAFRATLVGYTNAGKSSILRGLSGSSDVFVEDRLFATLDPLTRSIEVGENYPVLVTDTVGFIRKLPHNLVASFRATLAEVRDADVLLHVVDASHSHWEEHLHVVEGVLSEIGASEIPVLFVFNKTDTLSEDDLRTLHDRVVAERPGSVFVSAMTEGGLEPLRRALLASIREQRPLAEVRVPAADGRLLAEIHRTAEVLEEAHEGETVVLRARVGPGLAGKLQRGGLLVYSDTH
ncbi:GTPase HflX [soil metagenome]